MGGSILEKFGALWDRRPNQDWGNGGYAHYQGGTRTFESDLTDVLSRGFSPHGVYRDFASVRNEIVASASAKTLMDMARYQLDLEQVEGMLGDSSYLQRLDQIVRLDGGLAAIDAGFALSDTSVSPPRSVGVRGAQQKEIGSECNS